jgi:hypothetical protein
MGLEFIGKFRIGRNLPQTVRRLAPKAMLDTVEQALTLPDLKVQGFLVQRIDLSKMVAHIQIEVGFSPSVNSGVAPPYSSLSSKC